MFVRVTTVPQDGVAELPDTQTSRQTDVNETYCPSILIVFCAPLFCRNLVVLPGDVPARRAADQRHLRAAGVLHRNLLLRRVRRPPHQDEQVGFVNLNLAKNAILLLWEGVSLTL